MHYFTTHAPFPGFMFQSRLICKMPNITYVMLHSIIKCTDYFTWLKSQYFLCRVPYEEEELRGKRLKEKGQTRTTYRPPLLEMQVDNGINLNHCTLGYFPNESSGAMESI